jgi:hypothetical protein
MAPFDFTDLRPGDRLHYAGLGYGCDMVLTDVGPLSADHLGRPCRTASMVRADNAGHSLHMTISVVNAAGFTRISNAIAA